MSKKYFIPILIMVLLLSTGLSSAQASTVPVVVVKDIYPGTTSSFPDNFKVVNGILFFIATQEEHGYELWRSNGTAAGTTLVKDIRPGPETGVSQNGNVLVEVNGILYFHADDGVHGVELWRSDGTENGTYMVKDIVPGINGSIVPAVNDKVGVNGTLFFAARDEAQGQDLWKSDGTEAGTVKLMDFETSRGPRNLSIWNGLCVFSAHDGTHGFELWKSDGTGAGTQMIKDILPGSNDSYPAKMIDFDGVLYFTANGMVGSYQSGEELYRSDGTAAGTFLVKNINPGQAWSSPLNLTVLNGILYFSANHSMYGYELWRSDGTESGTFMVKDLVPGTASSSAGSGHLVVMNGKLYFDAWEGAVPGLAVSDGTEAGTRVIKQTGSVLWLTPVGGALFFQGEDETHGTELWMSDGTEAGTGLAADISPYSSGSDPRTLTDVNGTLFFAAWGPSGMELMRVTNAPKTSLKLSATSMNVGEVVTMTADIVNLHSQNISELGYTHTLPPNLLVANPPNATNTCAGILTATAGSGNITLSDGVLALGASCTVSVDVTSTVPGTYTTSIEAASAQETGPGGPSQVVTLQVKPINTTFLPFLSR